jgi:hypothetical protein
LLRKKSKRMHGAEQYNMSKSMNVEEYMPLMFISMAGKLFWQLHLQANQVASIFEENLPQNFIIGVEHLLRNQQINDPSKIDQNKLMTKTKHASISKKKSKNQKSKRCELAPARSADQKTQNFPLNELANENQPQSNLSHKANPKKSHKQSSKNQNPDFRKLDARLLTANNGKNRDLGTLDSKISNTSDQKVGGGPEAGNFQAKIEINDEHLRMSYVTPKAGNCASDGKRIAFIDFKALERNFGHKKIKNEN